MELPPLPADRQHELELQLEQLLNEHHFFRPRPRQGGWPRLYINTGNVREDPDRFLIDATVSFARDWFARLAMAYSSYWYETRKSDSDWLPIDWLSAIK